MGWGEKKDDLISYFFNSSSMLSMACSIFCMFLAMAEISGVSWRVIVLISPSSRSLWSKFFSKSAVKEKIKYFEFFLLHQLSVPLKYF